MQIMALIRRYGAATWQHRWKALFLAWIVCLGGWAYVYSLPNQYRASARLYADADAILSQLLRGIAVDSVPARQVDILQRTLLSRPNLERIVASTGLDLRARTATEREELIAQTGRNIRLATQGRNLFVITYTDVSARMSRDVVQAVLTLFMEQATSQDRQQMENARNFVNQQIAAYEVQLREAEQRRAEFRARFVDLLPSDANGGLSRLEASRGRLATLRGELADAVTRRDVLRQQLQATPPSLAAGEGGGPGGNSRVLEAERQLRELRLRFTEQHPAVIAARNDLAELRATGSGEAGGPAIRGGGQQRPNPLYEQLRTRLVDSETQLASIERQVQEEMARVERLEALARTAPQVQAQFQNLDRDYTVLRRSYEELLSRRESVQIAGAARTGADRVRLEVVDPPALPLQPVGPNRILLSSGVLAGGLGAAVLLAVLLAQLDRGFYTIHDLRKLGLPVLGSISSVVPRKGAALAVTTFAMGLLLLIGTYGAVIVGGRDLVARLPTLIARFMA